MSSVRKRHRAPRTEAEARPRKLLFTPTNVGIVFAIIIIVSIGVYWKTVHVAMTSEITRLKAEAQQQRQQAQVFQKKAKKLSLAKKVNEVMEAKLEEERKYFLKDLRELISPFFNEWLYDLLVRYNAFPEEIEIDQKIKFPVTWMMDPYEIVIRPELQQLMDLFEWEYIGENTGSGEVSMERESFLEPFTVKLTGFNMDYETLKKMIKEMQTDRTYLVTIHGFTNEGGENEYRVIRTYSKYDLLFSVYFMNPEGMVTGETPPGMPEDKHL